MTYHFDTARQNDLIEDGAVVMAAPVENMWRGLVGIKPSDLPLAARQQIPEHLTVYPVPTSSYNQTPETIRLWQEEGDLIGVPRGYYQYLKKRFGCPCVFEFSAGRQGLMDGLVSIS